MTLKTRKQFVQTFIVMGLMVSCLGENSFGVPSGRARRQSLLDPATGNYTRLEPCGDTPPAGGDPDQIFDYVTCTNGNVQRQKTALNEFMQSSLGSCQGSRATPSCLRTAYARKLNDDVRSAMRTIYQSAQSAQVLAECQVSSGANLTVEVATRLLSCLDSVKDQISEPNLKQRLHAVAGDNVFRNAMANMCVAGNADQAMLLGLRDLPAPPNSFMRGRRNPYADSSMISFFDRYMTIANNQISQHRAAVDGLASNAGRNACAATTVGSVPTQAQVPAQEEGSGPADPNHRHRRHAGTTSTSTSTNTGTSTTPTLARIVTPEAQSAGDASAEVQSLIGGGGPRPACERSCGGEGQAPNFCTEASCAPAASSAPLGNQAAASAIARITGELSMQEVVARYSAEKDIEAFVTNLSLQEGMTSEKAAQIMDQLAHSCGSATAGLSREFITDFHNHSFGESDPVRHVQNSIRNYIFEAKNRAAARAGRVTAPESPINSAAVQALGPDLNQLRRIEEQIAGLEHDFPPPEDATWAHAYQESLFGMVNPCPMAAEAVTAAADFSDASAALCTASGTRSRGSVSLSGPSVAQRNIQFSRGDDQSITLNGSTTIGDAIALQSMNIDRTGPVAADDGQLCSVKLNLLMSLRARRAALISRNPILLTQTVDAEGHSVPLHKLLRSARTDAERAATIGAAVREQMMIGGNRAGDLNAINRDTSLGHLRDSIVNICRSPHDAGRAQLRNPTAVTQVLNCFGNANRSGLSSQSVCNQQMSPEFGNQFCSFAAAGASLTTSERNVQGAAAVIQLAMTAMGAYGCATVVSGLAERLGAAALRGVILREVATEAGAAAANEIRGTIGQAIRSSLQSVRDGAVRTIATAIRNPSSIKIAAPAAVRTYLGGIVSNLTPFPVGMALAGSLAPIHEWFVDGNGATRFMRGNMLSGIVDPDYMRDLEARQFNLAHFAKDLLVGAIIDPGNLLGDHVPHLEEGVSTHGVPFGWYSHLADSLAAPHIEGDAAPYRGGDSANNLHAQLEAARAPDATPAQKATFAEAFKQSVRDMVAAARERARQQPEVLNQLTEVLASMERASPEDLVHIASDISNTRRHADRIMREAEVDRNARDERLTRALEGCRGELNCAGLAAMAYSQAGHSGPYRQSGAPTAAGPVRGSAAQGDAMASTTARPGSTPFAHELSINPANRNVLRRVVDRIRNAVGRRQVASIDELLAQREAAVREIVAPARPQSLRARTNQSPGRVEADARPNRTTASQAAARERLAGIDNQLRSRVNEVLGRERMQTEDGRALDARHLNTSQLRDVAEAVSFQNFARDFARQLGVDPVTNPQIGRLLNEVNDRIHERFRTAGEIARAQDEATERTHTACSR